MGKLNGKVTGKSWLGLDPGRGHAVMDVDMDKGRTVDVDVDVDVD